MSSRGNRAYTETPSRLQPPPLGPKPSSPGQRKKAKPLPHHPAGSGGSSSYSWSTDDEDYSPPIPPKPPSCVSTPPVAGGAAHDTGPFTLPELVSKFGRSLPLCVSVENGYQTDDERDSIGMGEMYNLHLVKHAKVVELRDPNGMTYNFPLSSSVQFAPIFSEGDERESCLEHVFERVADVVGHKPLPRLLRATKTFTKDNKTLVEKNEVLVVQRIATNVSLGATLMRKKSLRVFSTLHQVEKVLPSDCEGGFTDDSYATRLYISDIVSQFSEQFPLRVRVHITEMEVEDGSEFPYHLTSEVCELTEIKTETSLVASTYQQSEQLSPSSGPGSDDEDDDSKYIEIPINLGIQVNIFQPEQDDKESELFQRTKNLLQDFSTAKIRTISRSCLDVGGVTRKGYEREGVEIEESDRVYEVIGEQSRSLYRPYTAKIMQDPTYAEVDTSYQRPPPARPASDQKNEALPPPLSPKPPSRKTTARYTTSSPSDRPRVPSPLLEGEGGGRKKIEMGRKMSADAAAEAVMSKQQLYQPLVKPRGSASQSAAIPTYESLVPTPRLGSGSVTTGKKSQEAMMNSLLNAAGEAEDIGTLVRNLIGRIESLEQQVAVLSDKVERLSK